MITSIATEQIFDKIQCLFNVVLEVLFNAIKQINK